VEVDRRVTQDTETDLDITDVLAVATVYVIQLLHADLISLVY